MELIIAEKPSVATSIAGAVGNYNKKDGYLETDDYYISWCVGHLVSLANPEVYNKKYKKWNYEDLPILPKEWLYTVNDATKKQYEILEKLMNKSNVTSIVVATDSGREGELIFRLVYNEIASNKTFKRLWISSMEDIAIKEGMANLKSGHNFDSLYESALARSKADWIVGLNATRLFTTTYNQKLSVGRVQTPTLAMITERDNKINNFVKEKFYHVILDLGSFKVKSDRIDGIDRAKILKKNIKSATVKIDEVKVEIKKTNPPLPYDLTTLQRESNRAYGYTAKQTLDYTQSLYEKKLVTYPRTDSRYLTEDMADTVKDIISKADIDIPNPNIEKISNNKKVVDHHAIIPTLHSMEQDISSLTKTEQNIYNLILMRLLSAVHLPYVSEHINVVATANGIIFKAIGKVEIEEGYKKIEKHFKTNTSTEKDKGDKLPKLSEGMTFDVKSSEILEGITKPPKHYTEDTLLSAMEKAGAEALDKSLDTEKKGLGTPATRASIIEKLINIGYIGRSKKNLIATNKGFSLVEIIPENFKSPKLTAEWENMLTEIADGDRLSSDFMKQIEQEVISLVNDNKEVKADVSFKNQKESIGKCPRCNSEVYEGNKNFYCSSKECKFSIFKEDRFFKQKKKTLSKTMAKKLLSTGKVKVKGLYSDKKDKTYDAIVVLDDTGVYVNYKLEFENKNN